jgi:hypothetical protein
MIRIVFGGDHPHSDDQRVQVIDVVQESRRVEAIDADELAESVSISISLTSGKKISKRYV